MRLVSIKVLTKVFYKDNFKLYTIYIIYIIKLKLKHTCYNYF